jgi:hypothetical protein
VRSDGRDLKLVGKAGAGTSWSPDGTTLAVLRNGDIWLVAIDGSGQRRITQAERYGYENGSPQWHPQTARPEQLGGVPVSPTIPTDSVATPSLLRTRARIHKLAADGTRVALAYEGGLNCIELWQPGRRTLRRFGEDDFCGDDGGSGLLEVALAGGRLAWLGYNTGTLLHLTVLTATITRRQATAAWSRSSGADDVVVGAGDLRGGNGVLVFDTWNVRDEHCDDVRCFRKQKARGALLRIYGDRAKQIRSETVGLTTLATDGRRIAALRSDGRFEILRADGRLLGTVDVPARARAAAIDGRRLVVLTRSQLLVYAVGTRTLQHAWPLGAEGATQLAGVGQGFAAYVARRSIRIVRLSDGARHAIAVPGKGAVQAALTSGGLFYAYALPDAEFRGRVRFVSLNR